MSDVNTTNIYYKPNARERSIIFTADEVRAYLAGSKTQVRVPIKPAFDGYEWAASVHPDGAGTGYIAWWPNKVSAEETARLYPSGGFSCPYRVGDTLKVKEALDARDDLDEPIYVADGKPIDIVAAILAIKEHGKLSLPCKLIPASRMPPWAVRITPTITDVRVQRDGDEWVWALTITPPAGHQPAAAKGDGT